MLGGAGGSPLPPGGLAAASPEQAERIKSSITGVVGNENVSPDTDLVIEAVFEDFELKREIFSSLDSTCGEHTILATNTS